MAGSAGAYVVRQPGTTCDAASVIAYLNSQLARFKVPRDIVFVDTLPRNALGKVQHFILKEQSKTAVPSS